MAAILCSRFPKKTPELFSYQALIVRAARDYEDDCWVTYGRQFRREALARKDLDWSVPNSRLYNEAFTGRACVNPRCVFCLDDDHNSQVCRKNPNQDQPVCKHFNWGTCWDASRCKYKHVCSGYRVHACSPLILNVGWDWEGRVNSSTRVVWWSGRASSSQGPPLHNHTHKSTPADWHVWVHSRPSMPGLLQTAMRT